MASDAASSATPRQFEFLVMELWPILLGVRRGGNKVGEKWHKSCRSEAFSAQGMSLEQSRRFNAKRCCQKRIKGTHI